MGHVLDSSPCKGGTLLVWLDDGGWYTWYGGLTMDGDLMCPECIQLVYSLCTFCGQVRALPTALVRDGARVWYGLTWYMHGHCGTRPLRQPCISL